MTQELADHLSPAYSKALHSAVQFKFSQWHSAQCTLQKHMHKYMFMKEIATSKAPDSCRLYNSEMHIQAIASTKDRAASRAA